MSGLSRTRTLPKAVENVKRHDPDIIEKIQGYIKRTNVKYNTSSPYQMNLEEIIELANLAGEDVTGAICLAFDYGRAKGERSARAAQKRRLVEHG